MLSLLTLIVQIAVVLSVARAAGLLFRRFHQPQVVGEMVAGICLGPSLLGWVAPGVSALLFPPESLAYLNVLSQIGLLLFMFLVGVELNPNLLRGRGHAAVITSHVSIIAPFLLGTALALYLYPRLSDDSVAFTGFALFMGAAMSVTAFPVLARILTERNLLRTKVGAMTLACAAVDDVTAWCLLAAVVGLVRSGGTHHSLGFTLVGSLLYVALMVWVVRRWLERLEAYYASRGRLTQDLLSVILLCLLASAWITEWLGIHALFGAFLVGAVMPKEAGLSRELRQKLEDLTVVFLLPLFFAYTGLRTRIGLLSGAEVWLDCGLILAVAIAGKFGGSTLAAYFTGLGAREAGALGVLMNTRGLMELVILTIGLDLGVISPALFAMMVVMALVTTFMTTPILQILYPSRLMREEALRAGDEAPAFNVLISVALPSSGPDLLRVARSIAPPGELHVYALHLHRASEQSMLAADDAPLSREALQPLLDAAAPAGIEVHPVSYVSRDPGKDICDVASLKGAGFVLMGWHKPVLSQSILGGTVATVMEEATAEVVVYVARRLGPWRKVLVPYRGSNHDRAALVFAQRLGQSPDVEVTVLHVVEPEIGEGKLGLSQQKDILESEHVRLRVVASNDPIGEAVREARQDYDLVIAGISEAWGLEPGAFGLRTERLAADTTASLLIVRAAAG